ncbi:hypothetical protein PHSY_002763 [Pseudozyma hubeiensis SY62]|uniref:Uncharacterized protein n=1 Tax=Pseudozyma hubeiensis (strain SY62) TaxID=1305764 RepID=R9P1L1_PSEHS|nr:hypothetical protein PHSY_002763 [Pseudozyma hubeiensis SY62]GAC95188.1 hypothetical protein PHSY_002763 [Pseudozyma hubeiensis SY62]
MSDSHASASSLAAHALGAGRADSQIDDDIAATQRSILEELHTISEEALSGNSDHFHHLLDNLGELHSQSSVIKMQHEQAHSTSNLAEISQILKGQVMSQDGEGLTTVASPSGSNVATLLSTKPVVDEVIASQQAITEVPIATSVRSKIASVAANQTTWKQGDDDAETNSNVEAAAIASELLSLQSNLPVVTPHSESLSASRHPLATSSELVEMVPNQADGSFELDHADLFDGIEADAFDDIELSPPVRRHIPLPSLDRSVSVMQSQPPASPTRLRDHNHPDSLEGTTSDPYAEDAAEYAPTPQLPPGSQMTSFLDPCFAGFKTGHNKQVKLSDKALQRARRLMLELDESTDLLPPPQASQSSSQRLAAGAGMLSQVSQHHVNGGDTQARVPMQEIVPSQSNDSANGGGRQPSCAVNKVSEPQAVTLVPAAPATQLAPARKIEPHPFATPNPSGNGLLPSSHTLASPMRTPAAASGSRFTTPQPSKRISLGMMPRGELGGSSTGKKRSLPRFVTPFKGGKRPRAEDSPDPASPLRIPNVAITSNIAASPLQTRVYPSSSKAHTKVSQGPAVFRMKSDVARNKLAAIGRPEHYSSLQMVARGVPDEVLIILNDASQAARYAFELPDRGLLMQQQALEELHAKGCSNADMAWVQNHWTLILWKLAAMVRLEPSSASERWSWNELIRQLLYRYEREVHMAQRSCLKRIQERDSSAARPMVLVVSKILEEDTEVQAPSGEVSMRKSTILELSDGWYRIQAQIDPVLTNACNRGRLRIGHKLAITGATLDAQGEGKEVLSAYHMSSLVLAANSVSLARWDAKLGFAPSPFCASLRSLTSEGGLISLMDVVITRVYPLAYVDVDKSNQNAERGEQEEAEEREAWLKRRESAMQELELKWEAENRRLYDLVEALSDLAGESFLPSIPDDPTGRLESLANQVFDQLRAERNPASAVREKVVVAGHISLVPWLHSFAKNAVLAEDGMGGGSRLGAELDRICPPRKVRDFRIVKFRDARLPPPPPPASFSAAAQQASVNGSATKKKNPYARTVQLTVRDAARLGDELREGRRFLVTNLVPMSKSAWRKPDDEAEVYLTTRRDTKWRPVG